jgi:hypothetical protein
MWFGRNDDPAWKDIKTPVVEEGAEEETPEPEGDAPPDDIPDDAK